MRLFAVAALVVSPSILVAQSTTLFRHGRVFDGATVAGSRDALVRDGNVARIDEDIQPPPGAAVIDGSGKTLVPD